VAQYRAGAWKAAVKALDQSLKLAKDGDAVGRFVLAMAQQKLGKPVEANKAYEQAEQWQEKNRELLNKDKKQAEELRRFRTEAEEVLGRNK